VRSRGATSGELHYAVRNSILLLTLLSATAAPNGRAAGQQPPAAVIDVQKLGPQIGARVPEFSLRDQHGETRTLSSLMGPNGAILVFFRSADW